MLKLGELELSQRLILGTGKYPSFPVMQACHQAGETQLVTLAIRRVDLNAGQGESILDFIDREQIHELFWKTKNRDIAWYTAS